jgi:hypothetical protein
MAFTNSGQPPSVKQVTLSLPHYQIFLQLLKEAPNKFDEEEFSEKFAIAYEEFLDLEHTMFRLLGAKRAAMGSRTGFRHDAELSVLDAEHGIVITGDEIKLNGLLLACRSLLDRLDEADLILRTGYSGAEVRAVVNVVGLALN